MTIRAAVFDRDGVLLTTDRRRFARDVLARFPLPQAEVAQRWRAWLAGRALASGADEQEAIAGFVGALADELGLRGEARAKLLALDYRTCIRGFPDARPALEVAHQRGMAVGVLTNNSAGASAMGMLEAAGLADLIDVALSAQSIGASKPDPKAYRAIATALGVQPEACVFFDDSPGSCAAARALGMRAYEVDRTLPRHDIQSGRLRDLSALSDLLSTDGRGRDASSDRVLIKF